MMSLKKRIRLHRLMKLYALANAAVCVSRCSRMRIERNRALHKFECFFIRIESICTRLNVWKSWAV